MPIVETFGDLAFGDIFLHLLTGTLALLADEFAVEDFCSGLFDGFLLTAAPRYPGGRTGAGWAGGGLGLQHLWPLPGRRTCSGTRCGCSCTCTTAWRRPSCRPCRRRWSPPARWVPGHATCRPLPISVGALGVATGPVPNRALSPQSGEAVKELYSQLGERLEQLDQQKPSPAQAAESPALELPLPAVPAPAGL